VFIGADSDRRRAGRDGGGDGDEVKFQTVVDKNAGFPFPVTYFGLFLTVGWGNRQACTVIHELGITRTRDWRFVAMAEHTALPAKQEDGSATVEMEI
jgi:hypothetical protein